MICISGATGQGNRHNNQDSFLLHGFVPPVEHGQCQQKETFWWNHPKPLICGVWDGVGGGSHGEMASHLAATLAREIQWNGKAFAQQAATYIQQANEGICQLRMARQGVGMGSTAVLACFHQGHLQLVTLGDSQCYRLRKGALTQLTTPHVRYSEIYQKEIISQYLGLFSHEVDIEPRILPPIKVEREDIYLLCSDGISDQLPQDVVQALLTTTPTAEVLVEAAVAMPKSDNATAVVIQFGGRRPLKK